MKPLEPRSSRFQPEVKPSTRRNSRVSVETQILARASVAARTSPAPGTSSLRGALVEAAVDVLVARLGDVPAKPAPATDLYWWLPRDRMPPLAKFPIVNLLSDASLSHNSSDRVGLEVRGGVGAGGAAVQGRPDPVQQHYDAELEVRELFPGDSAAGFGFGACLVRD